MCSDGVEDCGQHEAPPELRRTDAPPALSRRRLLLSAAGLTAGGMVFGRMPSAEAAAVAGESAVSMAMHIHSSFSEQQASMDSQLFQAQLNSVDVLWWTDHDHRMRQSRYRSEVHFTSLTAETTDGRAWNWQQQTAGSLTADSTGGIVDAPASPHDPVALGSLSLTARSTSTATASLGFYANAQPASLNYSGNLHGQTLTLDVLPTSTAPDAYLELRLTTSHHPATGGRPAGVYALSYRFGGPGVPGTRVTDGLVGIVNVPVVSNEWSTVAVTPTDDIAALWPDLPAQDFASWKLNLTAVSTGGTASGFFDYLRFTRQFTSGDIPLQTQRSLEQAYATRYPRVAQRHGLEVSMFNPHLNWFGGAVVLPDYSGVSSAFPVGSTNTEAMKQQVATAHGAGGVVSYNHPYGSGSGTALPLTTQDSQRTQVAKALLGNKVLGCDVLEVGYRLRAGMDLGHHLGLWDVLSRNAVFVTGNGVSDEHGGQNWKNQANNWITSVWAPDNSESALLAALRSGRAWAASLSRFRGTLDLLVDATVPMGSASVSTVGSRSVRILATGLPAGSKLQVLRGTVDFAGTANATPNTRVVAAYAATSFTTGSVTLNVDTRTACFVRTQVVDSAGVVIAFSNPVWLLRSVPAAGIPAARAR